MSSNSALYFSLSMNNSLLISFVGSVESTDSGPEGDTRLLRRVCAAIVPDDSFFMRAGLISDKYVSSKAEKYFFSERNASFQQNKISGNPDGEFRISNIEQGMSNVEIRRIVECRRGLEIEDTPKLTY